MGFIGRTPLEFYKINSSISTLVKVNAGDYIRLKPIDEKEYYSMLSKQ